MAHVHVNVDFLLRRAHYRCEYCQTKIQGQSFEREHIKPRAERGSDSPENLAVACYRCNRNKSARQFAKDPVTRREEPLFDPRRDRWEDHFGFSGPYLVGTAPRGRATATLLFRSTPQYITVDLKWPPIQEIRDETLREHLNHQRARRLANQFTPLARAIKKHELLKSVSATDRERAIHAMCILEAELLFTRSRVADVQQGIRLVEHALSFTHLPDNITIELLGILSILYQQLATIFALKGNILESLRWQAEAARVYSEQFFGSNERSVLSQRLRLVSLPRKFDVSNLALFKKDDMKFAIEQAQQGQLAALTYLIDAQLSMKPKRCALERILEAVERILLSCGYGQDFDYARGIVLRRRWWGLRMLSGELCDIDLLATDLEFWKSIGMQNELRELLLLLQRLSERVRSSQIKDMVHLLDQHMQLPPSLAKRRTGRSQKA